jgi:G0-opsin
MLCLGMMVAWFPYAIVSLISAAGGKDLVSVRMTVVPVLLAKSSYGYNPLIYFLTVSDK